VKPLFGVALLLAAALVVAGTDARLQGLEKGLAPGHHLLYLPNGRYLKVATLGYSALAADVIYLWSIQFYGNFQIEDRYKYVDHIYSNVITDLDPHYFDPYWLGALILSVETKDIDKALKLLDKGFANNPDKWIFPYLAGWECAYAHQYERAIEYFRKAAAVPSAPPDVTRLVAGMYQREGDKATALAEWSRIARETTDPSVRKIALNRVHALEIEVDVEKIRAAIDRYRAAHGSAPPRLRDLVREGFLDSLPTSPDGEEYAYDWRTGTVSAGPPRVIPP
jgi:tetratricopeptide (TPR) repeat protein